MADVTSRTLAKTKVMVGRVSTIAVGDGTDLKLQISGLQQDGVITVTETVNEIANQLEDGTETIEVISREVNVEFVYSDLLDTDIDTINGATINEIEIKTSTGGANGTGMIFNIGSCDDITAYLDAMKTHVVATKSVAGNTITYTVTDVAA
jgi:hypothetical protein